MSADEDLRALEREVRAAVRSRTATLEDKLALVDALDDVGRGDEWRLWLSEEERRAQVEARAKAEFESVRGKTLLARWLVVNDDADSQGERREDVAFDPPIKVRATRLRLPWSEHWLNPRWDVEVLEPERLAQRLKTWWSPQMFGASRTLDGSVDTSIVSGVVQRNPGADEEARDLERRAAAGDEEAALDLARLREAEDGMARKFHDLVLSWRDDVPTPRHDERAYRWFRDVMKEGSKRALDLARAERAVQDQGWEVRWEEDDCSHLSDDDGPIDTCEHASVRDQDGNVLASHGGITNADANYRRYVEAELASEALQNARELYAFSPRHVEAVIGHVLGLPGEARYGFVGGWKDPKHAPGPPARAAAAAFNDTVALAVERRDGHVFVSKRHDDVTRSGVFHDHTAWAGWADHRGRRFPRVTGRRGSPVEGSTNIPRELAERWLRLFRAGDFEAARNPGRTWKAKGRVETWLSRRRPFLRPTAQDVAKATGFFAGKWAERARERGLPSPSGLRGSCKFASLFAAAVFGGEPRGNEAHQWVEVAGRKIDLTGAAGVRDEVDSLRRAWGERAVPAGPEAHDPSFWLSPDHAASLASCLARVDGWVEEFREEVRRGRA